MPATQVLISQRACQHHVPCPYQTRSDTHQSADQDERTVEERRTTRCLSQTRLADRVAHFPKGAKVSEEYEFQSRAGRFGERWPGPHLHRVLRRFVWRRRACGPVQRGFSAFRVFPVTTAESPAFASHSSMDHESFGSSLESHSQGCGCGHPLLRSSCARDAQGCREERHFH